MTKIFNTAYTSVNLAHSEIFRAKNRMDGTLYNAIYIMGG